MKWIHPRFAAIEAFALGSIDEAGRSRVAAHLATCVRCQDEVRMLRALQLSARDAAMPPMSALLRDCVLANAAAGDVRILPSSTSMLRATPSKFWLVASVAAAILVVIVVAPKRSLVAEPTAGTLSIAQVSFAPAPEVSIEYTPGALMEGAQSVTLHVTAYEPAKIFQPAEQTFALNQTAGTKFSAKITLPEGTVFVQYSVSSDDGKHVDDNDARGWEMPVMASPATPSFDGLYVQHVIDGRSNWEHAAAASKAMWQYYPENPASLRYVLISEIELAGSSKSDSVVHVWKPRLDALQQKLATAKLTSTQMWEFAMVGDVAKDSAIKNFWRRRLMRDYPRDGGTIQQRVFAIGEAGVKGPEMLHQFDALFLETGGQSIQLLANAFELASHNGDSASVALWGGRLEKFGNGYDLSVAQTYAKLPAFRERGMSLLRQSLAKISAVPAVDWQESLRTLAKDARPFGQWQLAALGEAMLAEGRIEAARDTLRRAAALAWDVKLLRSLGDAELAGGDTARALAAYAWVAADSRTTPARTDTLRARLGAAGKSAAWDKAFVDGQAVIDEMTLRRSIHRAFEPGVSFANIDDARSTIGDAIGKAPIAVIAYINRGCGPSLADLASLSAVTAQLKARGIPVLSFVEEAPNAHAQQDVEHHGFNDKLLFDDKSVVSRGLRQSGTPEYFVVENGRVIRYDARRAEDVKPFIDALARTH